MPSIPTEHKIHALLLRRGILGARAIAGELGMAPSTVHKKLTDFEETLFIRNGREWEALKIPHTPTKRPVKDFKGLHMEPEKFFNEWFSVAFANDNTTLNVENIQWLTQISEFEDPNWIRSFYFGECEEGSETAEYLKKKLAPQGILNSQDSKVVYEEIWTVLRFLKDYRRLIDNRIRFLAKTLNRVPPPNENDSQ